MVFNRSNVKKYSPSIEPDWDSIDKYKLTQVGCYWESNPSVPDEWVVCRYCGHVYDPSAVNYETPKPYSSPTGDARLDIVVALYEPGRLIPERQLLEGDCPECGE